jgi:ribosomal protein S19
MRINKVFTNERIDKTLIGQEVFVYDGRNFIKIKVIEGMANKLFREFISTKKIGSGIHIKSKSNTKTKKQFKEQKKTYGKKK